MNIVFTEDYHENQLVTSPDEIDKWIKELQNLREVNEQFASLFATK